jgi:hypothetical protein
MTSEPLVRMAASIRNIFHTKYTEFCTDLEGACPELSEGIKAAKALSAKERMSRFQEEAKASPQRDADVCPGCVLPGVVITEAIWSELSEATKKAVQEYLTLLTMCSVMEGGAAFTDLSGQTEFLKGFLDHWKTKLQGADFKNLAGKFAEFMSKGMAAGGATGMPQIPPQFMNGHIARLAEELVREFSAADFGISEAELAACESNPARAFELLIQAYTGNPEILQTAMKKIAKRMQEKIQRGELRPQDLAAEAEELMKTCTDNPAFTEMMEGMRNVFGMHDPDVARQVGRDGDARRNLVKERLRAKLDKRNQKKK